MRDLRAARSARFSPLHLQRKSSVLFGPLPSTTSAPTSALMPAASPPSRSAGRRRGRSCRRAPSRGGRGRRRCRRGPPAARRRSGTRTPTRRAARRRGARLRGRGGPRVRALTELFLVRAGTDVRLRTVRPDQGAEHVAPRWPPVLAVAAPVHGAWNVSRKLDVSQEEGTEVFSLLPLFSNLKPCRVQPRFS